MTPASGEVDVTGRAVLVLGVGRSGSAAAHALLDAGADVRVVDEGSGDAVMEAAGVLDARGALVRIATPFDRTGLLDGIDLVVPSPGVPPGAALLLAAAERGVDVWSEPELAWRLSGGRTRLVGVTGTNGKTTTSELTAAVLGVPAGGNIGTPLVTLLTTANPPPLVVAELSSFQLHHCSTLRTDVAVLLNVADDHLDWHGSRAGYRADKAKIWAGQRPRGAPGPGNRDWAVVGVDDAGARSVMADHPPAAGVIGFTVGPPRLGEVGVVDGWVVSHADIEGRDAHPRGSGAGEGIRVVRLDDLALEGPHNVANVCAAVGAAEAAGAPLGEMHDALRGYRAGAHRLRRVAVRDGVVFVDDSKATNPHAAAAAIASFDSVVWIAGGLSKGVDMAPLDPLVRQRVRAVVTIGTDGPVIAERARRLGVDVVEAHELSAAVPAAAELARPGDTVLLAPACASMDQFRDYAERGERFAAFVGALPTARGSGDANADSDHRPSDDVERTYQHGRA